MGNWLAKDPDQVISLIILIGALFAIFFGLGSLRRLRRLAVPVRRTQQRSEPEPPLGPRPVLWDMHCSAFTAGEWEKYQPVSVQARGSGSSSVTEPTAGLRDADITFLIAMPVPPASPPSSVLGHQAACADPEKSGAPVEEQDEPMPYVAIGTTTIRTPSRTTSLRSVPQG